MPTAENFALKLEAMMATVTDYIVKRRKLEGIEKRDLTYGDRSVTVHTDMGRYRGIVEVELLRTRFGHGKWEKLTDEELEGCFKYIAGISEGG